jgi:hypothetical protein
MTGDAAKQEDAREKKTKRAQATLPCSIVTFFFKSRSPSSPFDSLRSPTLQPFKMPNYVVSHQFDITEEERIAIAQEITHIHGSMFSIPELFVNVTFQPTSQDISYSGGKRVLNATNIVTVYVRNVSRTQEQYAELCHRIDKGWKKSIGPNAGKEKQLTSIFVQGITVAGWEQSVMLPEPGNDREWMRQHLGDFKKRAESGDEDMKALVEDIEKRNLI